MRERRHNLDSLRFRDALVVSSWAIGGPWSRDQCGLVGVCIFAFSVLGKCSFLLYAPLAAWRSIEEIPPRAS